MDYLFFLSSLYFFLPAYFANMTPPLAKKANIFNFLAKPIDGNRKFRGKPLFGAHKTWRGAILAIIVGILTSLLQKLLYRYSFFKKISFLDYSQINIFLFGFLISCGEVFGDLFFAFIKRRLNLPPGAPFIPFDQTNYVLGSAIFLIPFHIPFSVWVFLFFATFFLHLAVKYLGYLLKIETKKL